MPSLPRAHPLIRWAAPPVIAVVGPTGSGKSDLAVNLALALDGEVINADAMQFYRGMDIGTAKITVGRAPGRAAPPAGHHGRHPGSQRLGLPASRPGQLIGDIHARGKRAILVGGSGLYVRAALDVLEFPGTRPGTPRAAGSGAGSARHGAAARPPRRTWTRCRPTGSNDDRRIIRALEVHQLTGRPFSSFMPRREYFQPAVQIGLAVDREVLRERLADRVHGMVDNGLLAEVRRLDADGPADAARPLPVPWATRSS